MNGNCRHPERDALICPAATGNSGMSAHLISNTLPHTFINSRGHSFTIITRKHLGEVEPPRLLARVAEYGPISEERGFRFGVLGVDSGWSAFFFCCSGIWPCMVISLHLCFLSLCFLSHSNCQLHTLTDSIPSFCQVMNFAQIFLSQ